MWDRRSCVHSLIPSLPIRFLIVCSCKNEGGRLGTIYYVSGCLGLPNIRFWPLTVCKNVGENLVLFITWSQCLYLDRSRKGLSRVCLRPFLAVSIRVLKLSTSVYIGMKLWCTFSGQLFLSHGAGFVFDLRNWIYYRMQNYMFMQNELNWHGPRN